MTLLSGTQSKPDRVDYGKLDTELRKFLKQAANQDALIYFTGHGFTVEESEFDQRGYLATSSCKVNLKGKQIISQEEGLSCNKLNGLPGNRDGAGVSWSICAKNYHLPASSPSLGSQAIPQEREIWAVKVFMVKNDFKESGFIV